MVKPENHGIIEMLFLSRPEIANFNGAKYLKITYSLALIFTNISSFTVDKNVSVLTLLVMTLLFLGPTCSHISSSPSSSADISVPLTTAVPSRVRLSGSTDLLLFSAITARQQQEQKSSLSFQNLISHFVRA